MKKIDSKCKAVLSVIVLLLMFILMGDNNNDPSMFLERIFKPITGGTWTVYYAGIIAIISIYFSLVVLNEIKENKLIKTAFRRVIVIIIIISIVPNIWGSINKFYKRFSKNLNAIYMVRDQEKVNFKSDEDGVELQGSLTLKNCSKDTKQFNIKVLVTENAKINISEDYITLSDMITMHPNEEKVVMIEEKINNKEDITATYSSEAFEYILFNDDEEIKFKGEFTDYRNNEIMGEFLEK